jgi:hypothetical protein
MFGSNALEIAIGIVFVYLLLSLVCTVVNEGIANIIEQRGKNLLAGIKNLLNDRSFTGLAQHVYTHGLVGGVMEGVTDFTKSNRLPSYIAPTNFALALMDILRSRGAGAVALQQANTNLTAAQQKYQADQDNQTLKDAVNAAQDVLTKVTTAAQTLNNQFTAADAAAKDVKKLQDFGKVEQASKTLQAALATGRAIAQEYPDPLAAIEEGIEKLTDGHTKQCLLALVDKTRRDLALVATELQIAENGVEKLRVNLENWFNSSMDRFAGWYKRWTRQICFAIGSVLVVFANADSLMLANRLARDGALRAGIVSEADAVTQKMESDPIHAQEARKQLLEEAEKLNLPLGWINSSVSKDQDPFQTERIPDKPLGWILKIFGLLISALAVSLGAPFWFDTLSKFMNVRGAGKVPDTETASTPVKPLAT